MERREPKMLKTILFLEILIGMISTIKNIKRHLNPKLITLMI